MHKGNQEIRERKADFTNVYNRAFPSGYYESMGSLDYQIPEKAKPVIDFFIHEILNQKPIIKILDVGCSYGTLSALLKYNLSMDVLYHSYKNTGIDCSLLPNRSYIKFFGLDISKNAIDYSVRSGLLDSGMAIDLESECSSNSLDDIPKDIDIVVSTGCFGYITEKTILKILDHCSGVSNPLLLFFVMRPFSYESAIRELQIRKFHTKSLENFFFRQRKFKDEIEHERIISTLKSSHYEDIPELDGHTYATLYVSEHQFEQNPTSFFSAYPLVLN